MTLFFLASLTHPFDCNEKNGEVLQDLFNKIMTSEFKFPAHFSTQFKDLLSKMLQKKPEKRISINDILKHEWLVKN